MSKNYKDGVEVMHEQGGKRVGNKAHKEDTPAKQEKRKLKRKQQKKSRRKNR
jgi:hypothetical protein